jgi:hypothetical protein
MASITLSQPAQEALSPRTPASEPGPAAVAAKPALVETTDAPRTEVASGKVEVSLDPEAQRFVSTLTDTSTAEMLRKYPSESQLAYSRAVMAYLRTQIGK